MNFIVNFLRFSRFHTIIGTTLSITVLMVLAMHEVGATDIPWQLYLLTLLACLGANIYIVGLNQITDVEIDRINKPYLPLASGAFSMRTGYLLIGMGLLVALVLAFALGKFLLATVVLSLILGTMYSLPPFRLKRFHFWAAFCIIAVRGLIVNLLLYLHFQYSLNATTSIPPYVWLLTFTIFIYSIIIAWFKDIPDMEGDARHEIKTLSIQLGATRVFLIGNILISAILIGLMVYAGVGLLDLNIPFFIIAHLVLLVTLWIINSRVELGNHRSVKLYYQFIWGLFFMEYLTFAIAGII